MHFGGILGHVTKPQADTAQGLEHEALRDLLLGGTGAYSVASHGVQTQDRAVSIVPPYDDGYRRKYVFQDRDVVFRSCLRARPGGIVNRFLIGA